MKFADLHLHTIFSDGTYTPAEVVDRALKSGLSAISVVDHDTVEGIEPVRLAAQGKNLEVIPGIELTAEYAKTEIHILGYFLDYENQDLRKKLEVLRKIRVERIYKILDKLKAININLGAEKVFALVKCGTAGRLHIARAMVQEGLVRYANEAFQNYIGDQCPAYVGGFRISPLKAIKMIKDFGGIPVLAHPYTLKNDALIPEFVGYGLRGLEVYYSEHTSAMVDFYLAMAERFKLLVTGGSDCHGQAKPEVKIGSLKIPYELVEKLKQAKEKLSG